MTPEKCIEELAREYWINVIGMAEPKYCANDSWQNFLKGYKAALKDAGEMERRLVEALEKISMGNFVDACEAESIASIALAHAERSQGK